MTAGNVAATSGLRSSQQDSLRQTVPPGRHHTQKEMHDDDIGCGGTSVCPGSAGKATAPPGMADPAAWAVTAFATTSFMLGMYQSGLLKPAGVLIVLPAAFFFGGLVQIIVAVL
jgi:hypothetical protein